MSSQPDARSEPSVAYPTTGVLVGDALVFVATSFADSPRNDKPGPQHPDVLIHEVTLRSKTGKPVAKTR